MADEQDTREVLFPQWMGTDTLGLTIEQKGQGEIFVKEVKDESPAAHTGKVYEGDQIVGATIYFDNMSSEETADLLKTLNRHKVGLKLQSKSGDKSPCRSPMGTLSWEGRGGLGGSSSDILLVRNISSPLEAGFKASSMMGGTEVATVKGPV
uniref:PDZ domain-containing protein n=1 Tax=Sinocyclocheilus anshuiensis TaxID=1608454 RepID=A0A671PVW7_9TELE